MSISHGIILTLLHNNELSQALEITPNDMPTVETQIMLDTTIQRIQEFGACDEVLLLNALEKAHPSINWVRVLARVEDAIPAPSRFSGYQQELLAHNREQKAKSIGQALVESADVTQALTDLNGLTMTSRSNGYDTGPALNEMLGYLKSDVPAVKTGIERFDNRYGGFHESDLIILGARSSHGKTALACNIALSCQDPVLFVSGEQGVDQLMLRMAAIEGSIPLGDMRARKLSEESWSRLASTVNQLKQKPWHIMDKPAPTLADIVTEARRQKMEKGIRLVIVDYLQRMKSSTGDSRREHVEHNVRGLKELARELQIPVLCLAQINRGVDSRENKMPRMSDLAETSAIENEADMVMLLYRAVVYEPNVVDREKAILRIEKNRQGPTGHTELRFEDQFVRFSPWEK